MEGTRGGGGGFVGGGRGFIGGGGGGSHLGGCSDLLVMTSTLRTGEKIFCFFKVCARV
jgi:hypothetical protein